MARLWSSGLELNTKTTNVELTEGTATATIQTSVVRSGTYASFLDNNGVFNPARLAYTFQASDAQDVFYARAYFYFTQIPTSASTNFFYFTRTNGDIKVGVHVFDNGTSKVLRLWNLEDGAQVGSDSPAIDLNTWYMVELKADTTTLASTSVEARLNGSSFASGSINLATGIGRVVVWQQTSSTPELIMYVDDIAINDDSGSFQNSWPGEGEIIHLRPNAVGDNSGWGIRAGSADDHWEETDEITPDDVGTYIQDVSNNQITDVNLDATPAALESTDTITCVQVGVRFAASFGGTAHPFVLRIKASASGTVEESGNITPASATYMTNTTAVPINYSLTLYDLPGASTTAWTKTDLDATQIGVRRSGTNTWNIRVSTLWLLVDHTPGAAAATAIKDFISSNGFWAFPRS